MAQPEKNVRQSVSLPIAHRQASQDPCRSPAHQLEQVIVELIEAGLAAREREKQLFLDLAEQLARSKSAAEQKRLKEQLARITFGD